MPITRRIGISRKMVLITRQEMHYLEPATHALTAKTGELIPSLGVIGTGFKSLLPLRVAHFLSLLHNA